MAHRLIEWAEPGFKPLGPDTPKILSTFHKSLQKEEILDDDRRLLILEGKDRLFILHSHPVPSLNLQTLNGGLICEKEHGRRIE
ncbi:hypothetical protein DdX_05229 [Ditylenchus destructor]|uniref:Uncharacterized protein n=1 Tax=Ditylenchus destructor TaxID=166010 RepID=A0AAD4N7R0_9BILA|nr:hypothetical protein DdX_05229 [Ditylenchus destructor]